MITSQRSTYRTGNTKFSAQTHGAKTVLSAKLNYMYELMQQRGSSCSIAGETVPPSLHLTDPFGLTSPQ